MLPVVSTASYVPIQSPLINTAIPGSTVTHVPPDNVAPSVSNAQVDNNASANSDVAASDVEQEAAAQVEDAASSQASAVTQTATQQSQNVSVQAAYLAQLLADDASPETQNVLVQYEKLIALGNVKYKPSNAFKPSDDPASAFERILQQPVVQAAPPPPTPAPQPQEAPTSPPESDSATVSPAETQAPPAAAPTPQDAIIVNLPNLANTPAPAAQGFNAYSAIASFSASLPQTTAQVA